MNYELSAKPIILSSCQTSPEGGGCCMVSPHQIWFRNIRSEQIQNDFKNGFNSGLIKHGLNWFRYGSEHGEISHAKLYSQ